MRTAALALALAALVAGCGGGSASTQTTATTTRAKASGPAAFDDCLRPGPGVAMAKVPAPGERLPVVVLGGGTTGVVFANQSASITCGWLPYARNVARDGVRSVVFDYGTASREAEVLAIARWLRAQGAHRVVVVGASIGGRAVVTATARAKPGLVDAVVSLSGERILGAQRDLILDARRLKTPTLWVSSLNDGYTDFAAETRQLYRAAKGHARPDRLLVVGGDDHGIDLLTGPQAKTVVPAVTRVIRRG